MTVNKVDTSAGYAVAELKTSSTVINQNVPVFIDAAVESNRPS